MMSGTQACFLGTTSDAQFCFSRREENIELVKKNIKQTNKNRRRRTPKGVKMWAQTAQDEAE